MIQWIIQLFATNKTASDTDTMKPEVHEHQKNNMKSVSNKFLIVGLGNIGAEYVNTRHNIGFKVLDFLAKQENLSFETVKGCGEVMRESAFFNCCVGDRF